MLFSKAKHRYTTAGIIILIIWALWFNGFPSSSINGSQRNEAIPQAAVQKVRPKVFVIGLSKTGTTSVGDALSRLSLQRVGWEDFRSRFLFRSYLERNLNPLISLTRFYDAFEDLPWALVYREMAHLYPDAKFILTVRENEQDWLRSIKEHTARRKWIGHKIVYGAAQAEGNESTYLKAYRNHTSSVRKFFATEGNKTRLLEFVVDARRNNIGDADEDGVWGVILKFLEMEDSQQTRKKLGDFPWSNRTDTWRNKGILRAIWRVWDMCMYYLEGSMLVVLQCLGWLTGQMN